MIISQQLNIVICRLIIDIVTSYMFRPHVMAIFRELLFDGNFIELSKF
jgi:hypothetical protein